MDQPFAPEEELYEDPDFEAELQSEQPDNFYLAPKENKKHHAYIQVLKNLLPYLGSDETKIILTEVMIALKIEGLVGKSITPKENKMLHIIKDSILTEPDKKAQALTFAKRLLNEKNDTNKKT